MKILGRYIFKEIFVYFALCLTVFTTILVTGRLLQLTSLVINKGADLQQILIILAAIIPTFLEVALPVSALIGVMLAFARLSADSEIIVIRSSGVSFPSLIRPVAVFGVLATIFSVYVSIYLRPWGFRTLELSLFRAASNRSTSGLTAGAFNKLGRLTIYAEQIQHSNGGLVNVLVDDRRSEINRQIVFAKTGRIFSDQQSRTINLFLQDGTMHNSASAGEYNVTRFNQNRFVLDPAELYAEDEKKDLRPREMSVFQLRDQIANYKKMITDEQAELTPKEAKRKLGSSSIELVRRFSMPFACLILALLAMPFGIQPTRSSNALGTSLSIMIGAVLVVLYYSLFSLGITLGREYTLPPSIGLWIPNLVFAILALMAHRQIGSERWLSIVQGLEAILSSATKVFRRSA